MKCIRILRILGIAAILSLLVVAVPAAPALGANNIIVNPEEGIIGQDITITGYNFTVSSTERQVRIIFALEDVAVYKLIDTDVETYEEIGWEDLGLTGDTDAGEFERTFDVPDELNDGDESEDVTAGDYFIYVCITTTAGGENIIRVKKEFTVLGGGEIELDPDEGPVDTLVEITGEDFASDEDIEVYLDEVDNDNEIDIEDGDETESDGDLETYIYIPETTAGDHTIIVAVGSSEAEAEFTVEPSIDLSNQSGGPGDQLTVYGTGFDRRSEVSIYFNNSRVSIETANTRGSFDTTFFIPEGLSAGSYTIEAEDDDYNDASAPFTLTTTPAAPPTTPAEPTTPTTPPPTSNTLLNVSQTAGNVGSLIGIGGAGFAPNATVTLKYDDEAIATTTTDASGVFVATFQAPASKHGDHTITASDGTNTNEVTFTVESTAPETPPAMLLPLLGAKVKSPISFDWEGVTDASMPVTYTLQIATDEDFMADSIVLEKAELALAQYILTEEDELELAGMETPYYWRVRAVDAAMNESAWTGAGEFYVPPPFAFPKWALYTLLGIGAVIIFAIGYWLGRRTAFYY